VLQKQNAMFFIQKIHDLVNAPFIKLGRIYDKKRASRREALQTAIELNC